MAAKELVIDVKMQNQALKAEINRLNGQLDTLKNQAKSTGGGFGVLEQAVGKFDLSGKTAMSMVTKFAGALGVATTAGAVFNRMLSTSQGLGDTFEKIQTQVNSAMDYFAQSLANMDFNNFISGMRSAVIEGGKLADMLDQLQSDLQVLGVRGAKTRKEIGEKYLEYYSTDDVKKRQQIMDEILKKERQQREETKAIAKEQRATGLQTLKTAVADDTVTEKKLLGMIENYTDEQLKKMANRYASRLQAQNSHRPGWGSSPMSMSSAMSNGTYRVSQEAKYFNTKQAREDQIAFRLMDAQDSEGGPLKKARDLVRGAYDMETQVINEEVAILRKKNKTDAQAEAAAKKLLTGTTTTKKPTPPPAGSMAGIDAQISDLRKKLTFETDEKSMVKIQKEINNLTAQKRHLEFMIDFRLWEEEHQKLSSFVKKNPIVTPVKLELDDAKIKKQLEDLGKKIKQQLADEAEKALMKGQRGAEKFANQMAVCGDIVGYTAQMGSYFGEEWDKAVKILNQIAGAIDLISQLIPLVSLLTMKEEKRNAIIAKGAVGDAIASAAKTPIIGWLLVGAAAAAAIAALATANGLAEGGIVGGSSLVGDNVLARLNGGEMVLNQGQQARLFNLLDGTASLGGGSGEITWKLRGADLYGSLRNYNNIKKRVRG